MRPNDIKHSEPITIEVGNCLENELPSQGNCLVLRGRDGYLNIRTGCSVLNNGDFATCPPIGSELRGVTMALVTSREVGPILT